MCVCVNFCNSIARFFRVNFVDDDIILQYQKVSETHDWKPAHWPCNQEALAFSATSRLPGEE